MLAILLCLTAPFLWNFPIWKVTMTAAVKCKSVCLVFVWFWIWIKCYDYEWHYKKYECFRHGLSNRMVQTCWDLTPSKKVNFKFFDGSNFWKIILIIFFGLKLFSSQRGSMSQVIFGQSLFWLKSWPALRKVDPAEHCFALCSKFKCNISFSAEFSFLYL